LRLLRDVLFDNPAIEDDREALAFRDRRLTYGDLRQRVRQAGNALRDAGIGHGDRVAVLLENGNEFIELFYAITGIGAVIVPLNYRLSAEEHAAILADAAPVFMVSSPTYQDNVARVRDAVPSIATVIMVGGGPYRNYEDFLAGGSDRILDQAIDPEDTAALLYTSGTTSLPKGVMLCHRNYLADYDNIHETLGIGRDVVNLQISPLYHAAAQHTFAQIWGGGRTVLLPKFDPGHVLELIEAERINYLFVVPTMLYNVLDHPDIDRFDLSSIRLISYGAAPMTEARRREAVSRFGNVFVHAYGLTECTAHATMLNREEHVHRGGSIGRGLPGSELIVVDNDGNPVPPHAHGEIRVRGRQVMKGYWNRPEATAETLAGGWLHTGDIGTWDEDGYVRVVDRKKDIIISGGANIFPKDVEEVLAQHTAVAEVAVYGIPHDNWGETVEAAVVLKRGADVEAEALIGHARSHLAHFKAPRSIRFLDALPRNPSGKILKRELRQSASQ